MSLAKFPGLLSTVKAMFPDLYKKVVGELGEEGEADAVYQKAFSDLDEMDLTELAVLIEFLDHPAWKMVTDRLGRSLSNLPEKVAKLDVFDNKAVFETVVDTRCRLFLSNLPTEVIKPDVRRIVEKTLSTYKEEKKQKEVQRKRRVMDL